MADRRHSTVFDFLTAVTTDVQAATYPPHPSTGRTPWVDDKPTAVESYDEFVTVAQVADEGSAEWSRVSPGGRDEIITVEVVCGTAVPGRTVLQVLDRLNDLAEVVQGLYYDPTTFVFTPPVVDGAVQLGGFVTTPQVAVWATDQGHAGSASLRYQFRARI